MATGTRVRRGLTLVEVMIGLVLLGLVGAMFTKMLVAQGRFLSGQQSLRASRSVSRAPMNVLLSELRMVQESGGLVAAQADGKRVRLKVPYRFGILCATGGGTAVASMLPVDSAVVSSYAGWAWRASDGTYTEVAAGDPLGADSLRDVTATAGEAVCSAAGRHKVTTATPGGPSRVGRVFELRPAAAAPPPVTSPLFIWQYVAYEFKPSSALPGRIGLYRIQGDGTPGAREEELMSPFDTTARFRFFVAGSDTSRADVPASLATVRGLDLLLHGAAVSLTPGGPARGVTRLTTAVFFKNVRTF